ncbi:MAG: lysostaphin resistance A-like protein [Bacteroidaceae bacterium]
MNRVWVCVLVAALLWFVMFSPLTSPYVSFWLVMSLSGMLLTLLAICLGGNPIECRDTWLSNLLLGIIIAIALWCFFWVGDKVSQWLFSFARPQIDAIYDMKAGFPQWVIALLLFFVIGPAEEIFWRGFVQRSMSRRWGAWHGFLCSTFCYTAVHVWSGNLMLLLAAATCGCMWGFLYFLMPKRLPALIVSHALWDVAAFVLFPF